MCSANLDELLMALDVRCHQRSTQTQTMDILHLGTTAAGEGLLVDTADVTTTPAGQLGARAGDRSSECQCVLGGQLGLEQQLGLGRIEDAP